MSATASVRRLLVLVPWLLERPGAHVDEAAAAVDTDRTTLLADLSLLDFCGLPGRLGGDLFETQLVGDRILLQLAPAFDRPLRPTPEEALRLVLSLDSVAAALGDELPGLAGAVDALREAAGIPDGVRVVSEGDTAQLETLRTAMADGVAVELAYRGRADTEARRRTVDPWELVLHRGSWYLHAHDQGVGERRTFRLDRVEGVRLTATPASTARPDEPLPSPRYDPGPDDELVTLRIERDGAWVLEALATDEVDHHDDGTITAIVATDVREWIVQLVLAARGAVTVVDPPAVRTAVVEAARAGLDARAAAVAAIGAEVLD